VGSNPAGGVWMVVSSGCCVLLGRGLCVKLITHTTESHKMWCVWVWSQSLDKGRSLPNNSQREGVRSAVHRIAFLSDYRIQYITLNVCVVMCIMYAVLHCFECYCQTEDNSDDSRANFCKEQSKNSGTFLGTDSIFTL